MNDQTTSFSEFITARMVMKGYSSSTLAQIAGVSNRIIVEARMGLLENMLRNGITHRKLLGVSRSIPRLLRALDADEKYWMDRLGLNDVGRKVPSGHIPRSTDAFTSKVRIILDKPLDATHITRIQKAHKVLGDAFTTRTLLSILIQD